MEKMKRLSVMLLVSAVILTNWIQAEDCKAMSSDEFAAQFADIAPANDDATRKCSIKKFSKVIACDLIAGNATINNLTVRENLQVNGNETINGNLTVLGNYVPRTFFLTPGTDKIIGTLNTLSADTQNFGSAVINLTTGGATTGTYTETDFTFLTQLQDVTIIGDTNPLAGVSFMQGGIYGGPAFDVQRQLASQIGEGENYDIAFDATGTIMTVTASVGTTVAQPNFSGLAAGRTINFIGTDGTIDAFTVASTSANTITFTASVPGTVAGTTVSAPSDLGVAFVVVPNITIASASVTPASFVGIKNLKLIGINFDWAGASNSLILGGVNTKMELSNNLFQNGANAVVIAANEAYNRQPNTFAGPTVISDTSSPDFVYNSVWLATLGVTGAKGSFSYAQFAEAILLANGDAHIDANWQRVYPNSLDTAVTVQNVSSLSLSNAIIANEALQAGSIGVNVLNSSSVTTQTVLGNAPLSVRNFATGMHLNLVSAGLIQGATNPANFTTNTNDLEIDGVGYATIALAPNNTPGAFLSYVSY
jgi:hypothetical protein